LAFPILMTLRDGTSKFYRRFYTHIRTVFDIHKTADKHSLSIALDLFDNSVKLNIRSFRTTLFILQLTFPYVKKKYRFSTKNLAHPQRSFDKLIRT